MANWQCIEGCGACCHLDLAERPDVEDYLSPEELSQYKRLVGSDGWCINYDQDQRQCRIYEHRPDFCRVTAPTFKRLYDIDAADLNDFAIACCREQIGAVYGHRSLEELKFEQAVGLEFPGA